MRLENKVALISGGARGMGASEAKLFATEGASIVIGDVLEEESSALESEITENGGRCIYLHLDVTNEGDWENAIKKTVSHFGKIDVLVNNAGIGGTASLVEDTKVSDWDLTMDVNAKGVFLGTKAAVTEMLESRKGSIINISSQLGIVGTDNNSPQYQASKGAVRILTKSAAIQYAPQGIRVNSIHPGPIVTPMTNRLRSTPEIFSLITSRIPLGRYGQPIEIAYGALYLASDESSFVTGSELVIDGGWVAQ